MKHLPFVLMFVLLASIMSCSKKQDPSEVAAHAAKVYYGYLLNGKYDMFVDGMNQPDSIPSSYREQLIANAKMFVSQQKEEHHGIDDIRIVRAQADTVHRVAKVFLVLAYGDSTNEEIVVPMVMRKGIWYMR